MPNLFDLDARERENPDAKMQSNSCQGGEALKDEKLDAQMSHDDQKPPTEHEGQQQDDDVEMDEAEGAEDEKMSDQDNEK